jgi:hypothetical protein
MSSTHLRVSRTQFNLRRAKFSTARRAGRACELNYDGW